jgi:phosphopantothenoylcysteine decarboxylase/phosphopantothenate--cysteine ligase
MDMKGAKGRGLEGKRIALGVTGSVAAIESPKIARELMRRGADVTAFLTRGSQDIIHANTMEFATAKDVVTKLTGKLEHLWEFDLILIAPATANIISKMAMGIADDALSTLVVSSRAAVVVAPGMHQDMFANPIIKENMDKLTGLGFRFIPPRMEESKAKLAHVDTIVDEAICALTGKELAGKKVLVTGGPTIEFIDPIRIISNKSSGKMGAALAREAQMRGADVTLVMGPGTAEVAQGIQVVRVETASDMEDAVLAGVDDADILLMSAAVTDFAPEKAQEKIPTREGGITLKLEPTAKILQGVKDKKCKKVGFKALNDVSDEELVKAAREIMAEANLDMVVANDAAKGVFGSQSAEVILVDPEGETKVERSSKDQVAGTIMDRLLDL